MIRAADGTSFTWPSEGNAVSPVGRLDGAYTDGMGPDRGATFYTDKSGNGRISVKLDYDILNDGAPVSNKDVVAQCVPNPLGALSFPPPTPPMARCYLPGQATTEAPGGVVVKLATTWLRRYIGHVIQDGGDPARACANYVPDLEPRVQQFWQCIDPATGMRMGSGLPRVYMFPVDHFRLAAHPDDLTHGFIGGDVSIEDHRIDLVARVRNVQPK